MRAFLRRQQVRQAHHIAADDFQPGVIGDMRQRRIATKGEIVEDPHLGRAARQKMLGGGGADQRGTTHDAKHIARNGNGNTHRNTPGSHSESAGI